MLATRNKYDVFAFGFAFSFILNGYASGIPGISLGSLLFLVMIILSLVIGSHNYRRNYAVYILVFSFIIISLFDYGIIGLYGNPIMGLLKIIIWGIMINEVCPTFFRFSPIIRWMNIFSIILVAYLFLQLLSYYLLGTYLPNIFNWGPLKPYDTGYADYERLSQSFIYRPASLLSESSFCGNFLLATLVLNLEFTKAIREKLFLKLILSLGIVLCSSTSALVLLLLAWGVYFNKFQSGWRVFLFIGLILIGVWLINNPIEFASNTSFGYSIDKFNNLESSSRFGRSYDYLDIIDRGYALTGVGIGTETSYLLSITPDDHVYLNSITSLLLSVGYIGAAAMSIFLCYLFYLSIKKKSRFSFCLLLFYVIKAFGSGILFSTYGILFLMLVFADIVYGEYCNPT